jgi:hypothetical protein
MNATGSFNAANARQADVEKDYVRQMLLSFLNCVLSTRGFANNVKLGNTGNDLTETFSYNVVVIHDQNSGPMHL